MQGVQMQAVRDAMVNAFDQDSLTQVLRFRFDIKLFNKVAPGALNTVAFSLLQVAEMEGWEAELIEALYQDRPRNPAIRAVYEKFKLAPEAQVANQPSSFGSLEKIVRANNPMLDMGVWWERASRIEPRVCRVELQGRTMGTGFLVGDDVLLTNYHVLESVIDKTVRPSEVDLRFGFKRLLDGTILSGTIFKLDNDWLVDSSPFTEAEKKGDPDSTLPRPDQLDYALVRVAGSPGSQKVDRQTGAEAPTRGWIEIPENAAAIVADQPLLIVQHPQGEPLKLAIDMDAVLGLNGNGTRVRYRTNTEGGSSGSPCLDVNWNLLGLHHYGDPAFGQPRFNQGVPIALIRALLEEHSAAGLLGGASP